MGTTLTGTTPQDTYDSLIKVTDNGPLSGTAKYLSDGLGNDSALAVSTARVGIGTNSPNSTFKVTVNSGSNINSFLNGDKISFSRTSDNAPDVTYLSRTNDLGSNGTANIHGYDGIQFRTQGPESVKTTITSEGNVGIGTSSPAYKLQINASGGNGISLLGDVDNEASVLFGDSGSAVIGRLTYSNIDDSMRIFTNGTEKLRVLAGGGLTFNGDTAAANALDDYEEGTWTMGLSFGGAAVGVTYGANTGTYTKIGRQVTVNGFISLSSKGSSTGAAKITGLPFTIANTLGNYSAASLRFSFITFANQFQGFGDINTTTISLNEITALGAKTDLTNADFSNDSEIIVSLTYFV